MKTENILTVYLFFGPLFVILIYVSVTQQIAWLKSQRLMKGYNLLYQRAIYTYKKFGKQPRAYNYDIRHLRFESYSFLQKTIIHQQLEDLPFREKGTYYYIAEKLLLLIGNLKVISIDLFDGGEELTGEHFPALIKELHLDLLIKTKTCKIPISQGTIEEMDAHNDNEEYLRELSSCLLFMKVLSERQLGVFNYDYQTDLEIMAKYAPGVLWHPKVNKALQAIGIETQAYWPITIAYLKARLENKKNWDYLKTVFLIKRFTTELIKLRKYDDTTFVINTFEPIARANTTTDAYNSGLLKILELKISMNKDLQNWDQVIDLVDEYVTLPLNFSNQQSQNPRYETYKEEVYAHRYFVLLEAAQIQVGLKKYDIAYKYLKPAMKLAETNLRLSHLDTLRVFIIISKVLKKIGYFEMYLHIQKQIADLKKICK